MILYKKIINKHKQIKSTWISDIRFSKSFAKARRKEIVFRSFRLNKAADKYYKIAEAFIIDYLTNSILPIIDEYKNKDSIGTKTNNAPIWVCWWTGLDSAPALVKQCVKSIIKFSGNHKVNILDKTNISKYLSIPEYMYKKQESGNMGVAHLADYIRVCLLGKYGGIWLDATILCTDIINEEWFNLPVFTLKSEYVDSLYISKHQWTTFCLGGFSGNIFYSFLKDAFECYWEKENYAIDYLFFDYLIYIAYKSIPAIKEYMDMIPTNTPHRDDLQAAMNACLPVESFSSVIKSDTSLYKLSWRETYSEVTVQGAESIYGFFVNSLEI